MLLLFFVCGLLLTVVVLAIASWASELLSDSPHLAEGPSEGLIVHVAQVLPDRHMRYLDVWDSEAACDRFTETRLHLVVGSALARHKPH
jgi:hypothetical protein